MSKVQLFASINTKYKIVPQRFQFPVFPWFKYGALEQGLEKVDPPRTRRGKKEEKKMGGGG